MVAESETQPLVIEGGSQPQIGARLSYFTNTTPPSWRVRQAQAHRPIVAFNNVKPEADRKAAREAAQSLSEDIDKGLPCRTKDYGEAVGKSGLDAKP